MQKGTQQGMAEEKQHSCCSHDAVQRVSAKAQILQMPCPISSHGQVPRDTGEILCTKAKAENEYHLQAHPAQTWDTTAFKTPFATAQSNWKQKDVAASLTDQPSSSTKSSAVVFGDSFMKGHQIHSLLANK